jgi:hypothetical protein
MACAAGAWEKDSAMPDDLYDRDILRWSADQAARLRAIGHGEPPDGIEWLKVAEEIEDLGRREPRDVRSLLPRALEHLSRAAGWPGSRDVGGWLREAGTFLRDAKLAFTPSMARSVDVDELYRLAVQAVSDLNDDEGRPAALPETCPLTLSDLIPAERGIAARPADLIARFRPVAPAGVITIHPSIR